MILGFELKPRHLKVLGLLARRHPDTSCGTVVGQATGVYKYGEVCEELKKEGLVQWKNTNIMRTGKPSGWVATKKGLTIGKYFWSYR